MVALFWVLFLLISTHYVLFPLLVFILVHFRSREVLKAVIWPKVSILISAYNEEDVICEKLGNTLELSYPRELLEILVVSDGSSDRTAEIVEGFSHQGVRGLHDPPRRGKAAAMNRGVEVATGEIILFSDANTFYDRQAIQHLVANFADAQVGGVCGRKTIAREKDRESSLGDRTFWTLEASLKKAESLLGSIPTADGEIFAIRKRLYKPLPIDTINDDTAVTFDILAQGFRVVYEPAALSTESASLTLKEDMRVKARMVYGGYQTLSRYRATFFPPRSLFAWQFLCHKGLRHFMPVLLMAFFFVSGRLPGDLYVLAWYAQASFYLLAFLGALALVGGRRVKVLYLPLYYCAMNYSAGVGLYYFVRAKSMTQVWTKAKR